MSDEYKIIAELVVSALGEGISVSGYVKEIKAVIDSFPNIRTMTHPMGTIIEAKRLDDIFEVVAYLNCLSRAYRSAIGDRHVLLGRRLHIEIPEWDV